MERPRCVSIMSAASLRKSSDMNNRFKALHKAASAVAKELNEEAALEGYSWDGLDELNAALRNMMPGDISNPNRSKIIVKAVNQVLRDFEVFDYLSDLVHDMTMDIQYTLKKNNMDIYTDVMSNDAILAFGYLRSRMGDIVNLLFSSRVEIIREAVDAAERKAAAEEAMEKRSILDVKKKDELPF